MYSGKEGKKPSDLRALKSLRRAGGLSAGTFGRCGIRALRACDARILSLANAAARLRLSVSAKHSSACHGHGSLYFSPFHRHGTAVPARGNLTWKPVAQWDSVQDWLRSSLAHAQLARLPPPAPRRK